jgi:hypothetical protein
MTIPIALETQTIKDLVAPICIGVAVVFLLIGTRLRRNQKDTVREEALKKLPSLRDHRVVEAELEKLLVDLQGLSRQISAQIDTRFCKLEVLLKEADEKIRKLEALRNGSKAPTQPEESDPEKSLIYTLADAGKTPVEIAREMNKNPGEIELILSLRRSRQSGIDYRIDD